MQKHMGMTQTQLRKFSQTNGYVTPVLQEVGFKMDLKLRYVI